MAPNLDTLLSRCETDLLQIWPNAKRGFVCPLCLRFFEGTENLTTSVSIEHIVPDALGGTVTTLTCRRCNNTAGTQLDSHLVKRVRVEGRSKPIPADVEFRGTKFRGEVHLPESVSDSFGIYGVPKQSDPREINRFFSLLDNGIWDGQELKVRLEWGYEPVRSAVALLRSAYLLMFRLFGYRYVYDRSAVVIRESISQPTMETDGLRGISWRVECSPPSEIGVSIVTQPREFRSFMVFLTLDKSQNHVSAIALPPPNAGSEFFHSLAQGGKRKRYALSSWIEGDNKEIMPLNEVWRHVISRDELEPSIYQNG